MSSSVRKMINSSSQVFCVHLKRYNIDFFCKWAAGSEEFYAFKTPYVRLIFDP